MVTLITEDMANKYLEQSKYTPIFIDSGHIPNTQRLTTFLNANNLKKDKIYKFDFSIKNLLTFGLNGLNLEFIKDVTPNYNLFKIEGKEIVNSGESVHYLKNQTNQQGYASNMGLLLLGTMSKLLTSSFNTQLPEYSFIAIRSTFDKNTKSIYHLNNLNKVLINLSSKLDDKYDLNKLLKLVNNFKKVDFFPTNIPTNKNNQNYFQNNLTFINENLNLPFIINNLLMLITIQQWIKKAFIIYDKD